MKATYTYGNALVRKDGETPLFDGLGSERTVTNSSQTVTGTLTMDGFGCFVASSGSNVRKHLPIVALEAGKCFHHPNGRLLPGSAGCAPGLLVEVGSERGFRCVDERILVADDGLGRKLIRNGGQAGDALHCRADSHELDHAAA